MAGKSRTCTHDSGWTWASKVLWICLIVLVVCTLTLAVVHGTDECPYDPDGCPLCQLAHGAKLESPVLLVDIGVHICRLAITQVIPPCLEDSILRKDRSRAPPPTNCTGH